MRETWNTFFASLPFTVTLVWTVILLLDYKESGRARKFLTLFSLTCCILYLAHAVHFVRGKTETDWVDCVYTFCHLAVYPLYYIYIRILTDASKVRWKEYWVLLPAFGIALAEGVVVLAGREPVWILRLSDLVFPLEILLVFVFGYRRLRRFNRDMENIYADTEGKSLRPILLLLVIFALSSFVSVVSSLVGRDSFLDSPLLAIPSIVLTTMIFAVLYVGYRQDFSADRLEDDLRESPELTTEPSSRDDLLFRIRKEMEINEMYRRQGLKISDLSAAVMSNRTYVSNCINKNTGQSFSDFVNTYRVEYVKRCLKSDPEANISDLGTRAGFSGESVFFRNFKKATGRTPSEWLRLQ